MSDTELEQLKAQIQRLNDIEDIKQLKALYFEYADGQEWERYGSEVITEDFYFDSDAPPIRVATPSSRWCRPR